MADSFPMAMATVAVGVCATVILDGWLLFQARALRIAGMDFGLLGRWVGHVARGRLRHHAIASSTPVHAERIIGWLTHYGVGIGLAAALIAIAGRKWLVAPTLVPALGVGLCSVLLPFLVVQPAMGAGFAASRSPHPGAARLRSLVSHGVFGIGLFAGGWMLRALGFGPQ